MQKLDAKTDGKSMDVVSDNIMQLNNLFPEVFTEGKINFEILKQLLGEYTDDREERYSFNWNGKSQARMIAQTPSTGTLLPCAEESIDWGTTQNLFIEGDNLEVLKLLQKSYYKKVKMIYLDPPYNTGNEFIYPDKYQDNLSTYLRYTGQVNDEGFKLSTNSETSGRYHTNWLNMMYPRLKLARNLLSDDGIILISIDENEVINLKKICDEVFGEENFLASFIWIKKSNPPNNVVIGSVHEYVLAFSRNIDSCKLNLLPRSKEIDSKYINIDEDPRGPWVAGDLSAAAKGGRETPSLMYEIINPHNGQVHLPPSGRMWIVPKKEMEQNIRDERIYWGKNNDGKPKYKRFLSEVRQGESISTLLDSVGTNSSASKDLNKLFDGKILFETPKPIEMLKLFAMVSLDQSDLVLDFFAGSCTTAHAVLDLNKEDGGNRKFIMVQLPEPCGENSEALKAGYKTIAEIGKERIRRAIKKIKEESPEYKGDLGFKVFKLDSTNVKPWDVDEENLQTILEDYISNIKDGRSEHDVLYEILLKYGLDLTLPVEERKIAGKTVFVIGAGALIICLDDDITLDVVEGIVKLKEELQPEIVRVVFKDLGFKGDVVKTNTLQILKLAGIDDVKSI